MKAKSVAAKSAALLMGLLAAVFSVRADDIRRISLGGKEGVPTPAVVTDSNGISRIRVLDQAALELFPTAKKPSRGTVMVCPGGGYSILAVEHEGRDVARMLNAAGYDATVLLYHIGPSNTTKEAAFEDGKTAFALTQKRAAEFGLATNRIGAMGFSAGGNLCARLAHTTESNSPPDFLVLMYPGSLAKEGKLLDDVMPIHVPVFLYVAANDKLSAEAKLYDAACKERGISCEFHLPENGGHGFGIKSTRHADVQDWPEKLRAFLDGLK